jgi:hypothetical protein
MTRTVPLPALVFLPALSGCPSLYVEAQAATYPSTSYTENTGTAAGSGASVSGSSYSVGVAAGFEFDLSRKGRFALGYQSIATHVGGGGTTTGGASDARYDLKLAALGESIRIRLAMGFGFGTADSTGYKDASGAVLAAKTGTTAGVLYAGPAISRYFGAHHEFTAMLGAQYFFAGVPGGSLGSTGAVAKLTYTFHIANSWPDVSFDMSVATSKNIMPIIQQAAEQVGCHSQASLVTDDRTAAALMVRCSGAGTIFFSQTTEYLAGFCQDMSAESCHALVHGIDEKAAALISPPAAPPAAPTPPAAPAAPPLPAPAPAPPPPPPPPSPDAAPAP